MDAEPAYHQWVVITITQASVERTESGEFVVEVSEVDQFMAMLNAQVGCQVCDCALKEGWNTPCPGRKP